MGGEQEPCPPTILPRFTPRRFIPAWAGNRRPRPGPRACGPVHPRVGGEQDRPQPQPGFHCGSSPRGRGTVAETWAGLSAARFIPAWAGNSPEGWQRRCSSSVHPRVGGEQMVVDFDAYLKRGSSPRGRGTGVIPACRNRGERFIPAWAGNRRQRYRQQTARPVHPRVGGEQNENQGKKNGVAGSSPRGRGTVFKCRAGHVTIRFIPAWAGNSNASRCDADGTTVHPRVGGEQPATPEQLEYTSGSSPRGRGTDAQHRRRMGYRRFIPAWAGNSHRDQHVERDAAVHPRVGGEQ